MIHSKTRNICKEEFLYVSSVREKWDFIEVEIGSPNLYSLRTEDQGLSSTDFTDSGREIGWTP